MIPFVALAPEKMTPAEAITQQRLMLPILWGVAMDWLSGKGSALTSDPRLSD